MGLFLLFDAYGPNPCLSARLRCPFANLAFFRELLIREGKIVRVQHEEQFATLLGSQKGSFVDQRGHPADTSEEPNVERPERADIELPRLPAEMASQANDQQPVDQRGRYSNPAFRTRVRKLHRHLARRDG